MTYLVATVEVIYEEQDIIKRMLETGEYGIGGYPISEESMVEFVKNIEFGLDHEANFKQWGSPLFATIKDEGGKDLWYCQYGLETLDKSPEN